MMRLARMLHPHRFSAALFLALASAGSAAAQDAGSHPVDSALEMLNLKTQAGPMPDFVTQTRGSQAEDGYIPIGAKPPARGIKPKSAAEVKSLTAELDAARDAQIAGKRPKPMGSASAPKKAAKTARKPATPQSAAQQATIR